MKEETLDERGVRNAIVNLLHNEGINLKWNNGVNMCSISTEMFIPFACLPQKRDKRQKRTKPACRQAGKKTASGFQ